MEELQELLDRLRGKLQYTRRLTEEYDHAMDFASHCTMQGLAEGIEFAIEEIEELIKEMGPGAGVRGPEKIRKQSKGKEKSKGKARANVETAKAKTRRRGPTAEKNKGKAKIGVGGKKKR